MLAEVFHEVGTEPHLQPLSGEHLAKATAIRDNNARLDFAASGFWSGSTEKAMLDIRVLSLYPYQQAIKPVFHLHQAQDRAVASS